MNPITLLKAVKNYDDNLTKREAVPTGDDYNNVLDIVLQHDFEEPDRQHYHLVFAEVIFCKTKDKSNIGGTRVNVFTKAPDLLFPSRRLSHIQNACAMQARSDVGNPQIFHVHEVHFLNMYYLGAFTDEEFYEGIQKIETPMPSADVIPIKS